MTMIATMTGLLLFPLLMIHAALGDLRTMTIPNRLVLALLLSYAVLAPFGGVAPQAMAWSALGAAGVFAAGLALFAFGWMGGGDVKLMTAAALWLGPSLTPAFLVLTAVIGGLLTLLVLLVRTISVTYGSALVGAIGLRPTTTGVPYGVAIAAAAVLTFLQTPWAAPPW